MFPVSGFIQNPSGGSGGGSTPPADLSGYVTTSALTTALASHSGKAAAGLFTNSSHTMTDADWNGFIGMIPISPTTSLAITEPTSSASGKWTVICNFGSSNLNITYPLAGVFGKNSAGVIQNGETDADVLAPGRVLLIVYAGSYMGWGKFMIHYY